MLVRVALRLLIMLMLTVGSKIETGNGSDPESILYSVHHRLVAKLFTNYDPALRPVKYPVQQMQIHIEPSINQVQDLNTARNTIGLVISLDIYWNDVFLKWNPTEYDNITSIFIPSKKIWTPIFSTWYSIKSADTVQTSEMEATINYTGGVYTSLTIQTETMCTMDVTLYPFDQQSCAIYFGSFIHMYNTLKFVASKSVDLGNYYEHQEWKLNNATVMEKNFSWSGDPHPYSMLVIELDMQRQPFFYIFTMVMPVAIIVLVALLGFHIPGSSNTFMDGKIDLGMATLLSMTLLLYTVTSNLPKFTAGMESANRKGKTSGTPILVTFYVWLFCQVALSAMVTSLFTYVDKLVRISGEVPAFIQLLGSVFKIPSTKLDKEQENEANTRVIQNLVVMHRSRLATVRKVDIEFETIMVQLQSIDENLAFLRRINSTEQQWAHIYFRLNLISLIFNFMLWVVIIAMFFLNSWY